MNTPEIVTTGSIAKLQFRAFDLNAYDLFLRAKSLPEKSVEYDRDNDTYTLSTHVRYAHRLTNAPVVSESVMPALSDYLFDYQRFVVERAMESRRFAAFADTGLGKTAMQLECARLVLQMEGGKFLLLTFPQIIPQTIEEARERYPDMPVLHLTSRDAMIAWLESDAEGLAISNYEKLIPGIIPEFRNLTGLALDESSVLKTGGGKIKWNLIKSAKGIPFKFCFSATPAPNDVQEYASQAAFLEKIQGFWDYFSKRGDGKGDWYIKPHAKQAFYAFMSSWSLFMRSPKRFGFEDNLKDLPEPVYHDIAIPATDAQRDFAMQVFARAGSGMFGDTSLGVTHRSKLSQAGKGFVYDKSQPDGVRLIDSAKPQAVADLIVSLVQEGRQVLVWTVFDEESRLVAERLSDRPDISFDTLHGKMSEGDRLKALDRFRRGEVRALVSKAQLLGFGLNFQFVSAMVFSGWDDSYERFYQAVRRAYRYGQKEAVQIYLPVVTELEGPILQNLLRKRDNFEADAQAHEDCFLEAYQREV